MRAINWVTVAALACGIGSVPVNAAELGRQAVSQDGRSTGAVPVEKGYGEVAREAGPGVEAAMDWSFVSWKVGDESTDDQTWAPRLDCFYGVNSLCDIRASAKYFSAGRNGDNLDVVRLGGGTRISFSVGDHVSPYFEFLLCYYGLSGKTDHTDLSDVRGTIGIASQVGVAYLFNERWAIRTGIETEHTLLNGKADVGDKTEDVSLGAVSMGIGAMVRF